MQVEGGSWPLQPQARGDNYGLWLLQVTVWEALTNTRPGIHPPPRVTVFEEQLQLEQ